MRYKNLYLLILAFAVVYVQAVPVKSTITKDEKPMINIHNIVKRMVETVTKKFWEYIKNIDIMKKLSNTFDTVWKKMKSHIPPEMETELENTADCVITHEKEMRDCLVEFITNIIVSIIAILSNLIGINLSNLLPIVTKTSNLMVLMKAILGSP